jgi:hypothetical protein
MKALRQKKEDAKGFWKLPVTAAATSSATKSATSAQWSLKFSFNLYFPDH